MISALTYRRSNRGVPHLLFTVDGVEYSVCYFGKNKELRIWRYSDQ
jgi:hypothetical protein